MPFLSDDLLAALPRLRRYARVLTEDLDRADEMVKETLARARQLEPESPSGPTVVVRLFSMLRSVYVDEFAPGRPHGPLPTRESSSLAGADSTDIASESNALRTDELLAHLLRLPLECREVLVLVAVERMSYDDIATLLGVPLATVLARLTQARESFRSDAVKATKSPKSGR
jgi:RNA polymerase sigma-70 factor (ECF subfamily)